MEDNGLKAKLERLTGNAGLALGPACAGRAVAGRMDYAARASHEDYR